MTLEQLSNLQVGQRVSRTTATEVRFGTITKIYNGNYQTQVLFDHLRDPMAYGYKDLELVPNNENFKNTNTMKKNNLDKIRANGEKKEFLNFIEKVKKEMILAWVYHEKAKFNCFSDGIFSYSYSDKFCLFTFDIICEDTLFDKMKIKDLLEVKKIGYFDSSIYDKKTKEKLGGITYSIFDEDELTEEEVRMKNIDYYNEATKGIPAEHLWKGFYLSDGVYLQSDGTFSDVEL